MSFLFKCVPSESKWSTTTRFSKYKPGNHVNHPQPHVLYLPNDSQNPTILSVKYLKALFQLPPTL